MASFIEEVAKAINGIGAGAKARPAAPAARAPKAPAATKAPVTPEETTKPETKEKEETAKPEAKEKEKASKKKGPSARVSDLGELDPKTKHLFTALLSKLEAENLPFKVRETKRSQERQVYLYRLGRTDQELIDKGIDPRGPRPKGGKNPKPVTHTLNSNHFTGRAVDFVLDEKHPFWDEFGAKPTGPWDTKTPGIMDVWEKLGAAAKSVGLGWGGKWKSPDYPHVEVPRGRRKDLVAKKPKPKPLAISSKRFPLTKEGLLINDTVRALEKQIVKSAFVQPEMNPDELAQSLLRIIYHFAQKVEQTNQAGYMWTLKQKLTELDPVGVAGKKKNPSAGLGSSISVIKNVLSGEDPHVVHRALHIVYQGLDQL